jgi:transcriptional regulator with XRE-family HTH domain
MAKDKIRRAICSSIAGILLEERKKRGLSLLAVATAAGLSRQMIRFVEQETRNPTLDTLLRICDAIGVDFETVLKRAKRQAANK